MKKHRKLWAGLLFLFAAIQIRADLTPPAQDYVLRFSDMLIAHAPLNSVLELGDTFTIEAWVYSEALNPSRGFVVTKMHDPDTEAPGILYALQCNQTSISFVQSTEQPDSLRAASVPNTYGLNSWIHLAGTLSDGTMRLYINGVEVASCASPGTPESNNVPLAIGNGARVNSTYRSCGEGFRGCIRQARVWSRALTATEIQTNAVIQLTGGESGLVACWPCDDGPGQTVRDLGPSHLDITLPNSVVNGWNDDPLWVRAAILNTGPYFSVEQQTSLAQNLSGGGLFDFDSDGDLDFTSTTFNYVDGNWYPAPQVAYRNDGAGQFSEATAEVLVQNHMTMHPRNFAQADFNGDGLTDLFIADHGKERDEWPGGQSLIFIQTADGHLVDETSSRIMEKLMYTHSVAVGDIDNDGDIDIYMGNGSNYSGDEKSPFFYINDGSGYFTADRTRLPIEFMYPAQYHGAGACLMVDVNRDGNTDLVLGDGLSVDCGSPHDHLLLNDGQGHFTFAAENAMPPRPLLATFFIASGDFNADGWPDLVMEVVANGYVDNTMQLLLNNGDDTFRDATSQLPQSYPQGVFNILSMKTADLNGDGWLDLIASGNSKRHLYYNTGNAVFQNCDDLIPATGSGVFNQLSWATVYPGDLDGDGDTDIFLPCNYIFNIRNLKPWPTATALPFPVAPTLLAPTNGAIVPSASPVLSWSAVATAGSYRLQVALDPGFGTLIIDKQDYVLNTYHLTGLLPNQGYFWRVLAVNTRGAGDWSETRAFNTNALILLTPNGGENWPPSSEQAITWAAAGLAGTMTIELYKNDAFYSTISSIDVTAGSYDWTLPADLPNGNDYKVRIHLGENSDFSDAPFSYYKNPVISGVVTNYGLPVSGVILDGLPGDPLTDASGIYSAEVPYDWSGEVEPMKTGYLFQPTSRSYTQVKTDQSGDFAAYIGIPPTSGRL